METRNQYGFPVVDRLEQAKEYAAAAKERNAQRCDCETCRQVEMLPAVIRITEKWGKQ